MTAIIQIELPNETFAQLEQAAREQQRTVDEVAREIIVHELAELPALPEDVEAELAAFVHLSDDVLKLLATTTMSRSQQEELASLNDAAQRRDLSLEETERQDALLDVYNRVIVRRAEAAAILMERGYDPQELLRN